MRSTLLLVLLCCSATLSAKKMTMFMLDVILRADLVVVGTIDDPSGDAYTLIVDEVVHGSPASSIIRVRKWQPWICDSRIFKIERGQRLVLLLQRDSLGYMPINASTGEIPIENDSIVLRYQGKKMPVVEFTRAVHLVCCFYRPDPRKPSGSELPCHGIDREAALRSEDYAGQLLRQMQDHR